MKTQEITAVSDLLALLKDWEGSPSIFRGVSSEQYELIPSVGRYPLITGESRGPTELRLFRRFRERSLPYLMFVPRDDWEWLAVAQHVGVPTRLLDWTSNPLVAAYFAVERDVATNSAIFVCAVEPVLDKTVYSDPFKIEKVIRVNPPAISERIVQQSGLFTAHPDPEAPFDTHDMWKITIPNCCRRDMKRLLFKLGFRRGALFPGLDGTAADLTWEATAVF